MYSGIFGLLLSIASIVPGAAVLIICKLLHVHLILQIVGVIAANLCSSIVLHILSARKYVNFVPTE